VLNGLCFVGVLLAGDFNARLNLFPSALKKQPDLGSFEVSFIPSPKEYERLILGGYPDNEAGMMIKESLLGGGEVAPRSKNKLEEGLLNP
jgi:hypothetical protein